MADDRLQPRSVVAAPHMRRAHPSDLDALVDMEAAAFATDRISRRSFRALMARPSAIFLAADAQGELAGYALLLTRRGSRTARLYSIAVAPGWIGRNVGAALLTAAEEAARDGGANRISLEVRRDNAAARRLYESRGYVRNGLVAGYYADGATAYRYRRALPPLAEAAPATLEAEA